jgi:hypothetical protein
LAELVAGWGNRFGSTRSAVNVSSMTLVPHEASEVEITCFAATIDRMGWGAGMELLAKLLAELQD